MKFRSKKQTPDIDDAIHDLHSFLKGTTEGTAEYKKVVEDLAKLYEMKATLTVPDRLSKDGLLAAGVSLSSIVLILLFEGVGRGIITTKSLGFVPKAKNR